MEAQIPSEGRTKRLYLSVHVHIEHPQSSVYPAAWLAGAKQEDKGSQNTGDKSDGGLGAQLLKELFLLFISPVLPMASLPSLVVSEPFSQVSPPSILKPFNALTKSIHSSRSSFSCSRSSRSFSINACQLPLVSYPATDFEAEAVSDQEFIKVKDSDCTSIIPHSTFSDNVRSMEKLLHLPTCSTHLIHHHQNLLSKPSPAPSSSKESPKNPEDSTISPFFQKTLYLESIGLDPLLLIDSHPPIISCPLPALKSTVGFLRSHGFSPSDLRRIFTMCPEALTVTPSSILPVFTFLLREAKINGCDLIPSINRRPRLLVSDVTRRLRPTLYFLQTLGISDVSKHTSLLSCSVEDKFLPRLEYLQKIGFSYRDSVSMVRRFPQLFCLGIESNLQPKFNYFASEMRRQLEELKEFPQYFSFSLDCRIKPRHTLCADRGVYFSLPAMLKCSDWKFHERLELFGSSSQPRRDSPLWFPNQDV